MSKCEICGTEVTSGRKFCTAIHEKPCAVCGKTIYFSKPYRFEKVRTCSKACGGVISHSEESKAKRRKNSLERHGVEAPQQLSSVKAKAKQTNLERYGVEWPNQNELIREKGYSTNESNYGVRHPLQNPELKAKAAETLKSRYGVSHPSESPELRARFMESIRKIYGVDHPFQSEEVKQKMRARYNELYGRDYPSQVPEIQERILKSYSATVAAGGGRVRVSKINRRWKDLLEKNFAVKVDLEYPLQGKAFDLAVPDKNLLIEINPTVTHNSLVPYVCLLSGCKGPCEKHSPISQSHHQERAKIAKTAGMSLIQIYDWDQEDKILSMLAGKLSGGFTRYSARKLSLRKISAKEANDFFKSFHGQGGLRGKADAYGLFKDDELLAAASFGASRFGAKYDYEWLRYAVRSNTIIHGGSHRLFQAFVQELEPNSVISYVDFDHTTAPKVFLESSGFEELSPTSPGLIWSRGKERVSQNSLLRLGADRLLNTTYGSREESGLNNKEIMITEGFLPVYTAGNRVFVWKL